MRERYQQIQGPDGQLSWVVVRTNDDQYFPRRDGKISATAKAAAARARVTADRKRGVETPNWIQELAKKT